MNTHPKIVESGETERTASFQPRVQVLDGWRALSVMLVVISHSVLYSSMKSQYIDSKTGVNSMHSLFEAIGFLGVDIFFIISGFVIFRGILFEKAKFGQISLLAFYVRRLLRIVPPLFVYVSGVVILHIADIVQSNRHIFMLLTFTCNIPSANCGGYLGIHTWSLSYEEQFYIVAPIVFYYMLRSTRSLLGICAVLIAIISMIAFSFGVAFLPGYLCGFIFIAFGVTWALNEAQWLEFAGRLPGWALYPLLASMPLINWLGHARGWTWLALVLAPVICVALAITVVRPSRLKSVLLLPGVQQIGRASYGIYLWQQLATYDYPGMAWPSFALALLAMLAWSLASYRIFETPLVELGLRLSANIHARARQEDARACQMP